MKTTTRKLLAELQGLLDGPSEADKRRMIAVAGLCAAACVSVACGHDIKEAAARCAGRLGAFPREEWPALFDEARASLKGTPAQLAVLEQLIEAAVGLKCGSLSEHERPLG